MEAMGEAWPLWETGECVTVWDAGLDTGFSYLTSQDFSRVPCDVLIILALTYKVAKTK